MNEISIIKKIQLGENCFSVEYYTSKLNFSFYCANGGIKHQIILSFETSYLLDSLLDSGLINEKDLIENNVPKLKITDYHKGHFSYKYQIYNPINCNNTYLILFEISEYRDYFSCFIPAVFQIEDNLDSNT